MMQARCRLEWDVLFGTGNYEIGDFYRRRECVGGHATGPDFRIRTDSSYSLE
jgi:hypothetical protein